MNDLEHAKKTVRSFYPLMVVPGIVLLLAPSTVDSIMEDFSFGTGMGSLVQVSYFAGGVAGILLITHFVQKLSVKQFTLSQVTLLSLALLASSFCRYYPLLLFFYLIAGFANGILITFPGIYVTRIFGTESHRPQSILYSFFSMGVVLGPILAEVVVRRPDQWPYAFLLPALLIIPLSVPLALTNLVKLERVDRLSAATTRKAIDFNRDLFIGLVVALLLYIAAESTVSMWLVTFLEEENFAGGDLAHWILTALWVGLTVGRWICSSLARRINPFKIVSFITIASCILLVAVPLTGSKWVALLGYPMVGLFYSGIYPFLVGYVSWFPEDLSPFVFSVLVAAGAAGSAVMILASGLINQFGNRSLAMALIAVPVLGVFGCLFWLREHLSATPSMEAE